MTDVFYTIHASYGGSAPHNPEWEVIRCLADLERAVAEVESVGWRIERVIWTDLEEGRSEDATLELAKLLADGWQRAHGPEDTPYPFIAEEVNAERYLAQSEKERVA